MKIFSGNRRRLFKSKRAMELSINFIVMLIIAIVLFGFGLKFLGTFFSGGMKMQKALDDQTKRNIESLLSSGERVAIPLDNKQILRGQNEIVGIGILNVMSQNAADDFNIKVECTGTNCQCTGTGCEVPKVTYLTKVNIANNKQDIVNVFFDVGKKVASGTYIFNVCVARAPAETPSCQVPGVVINDMYDKSLHKVYVKVP
jgi:hypothetical protein